MPGTCLTLIGQRSAYVWLRRCYTPHFYRYVDRDLRVCNAMRYCVSVKDNHSYEVKQQELQNVTHRDTLGTSVKLNRLRRQNINELSNIIRDEDDSKFVSKKKFSKEILLAKRVEQLYPYPKQTISEIYKIVRTELKDQEVLTMSNKLLSNSLWECTYTTKWPETKSFRGISKQKRSAVNVAALKCLQWLEMNNKLRDGKPIVYNKQQFLDMRSKPVEINITPDNLKSMENLIEIYDVKVQDILRQADCSRVYETTLALSNYPTFGIIDYTDMGSRSETLRDRLSTRSPKDASLPICEFRDEILSMINNNQVILIEGDTGCGKTTQVPQFIMDSFTEKGNAVDCNILISQPRRISAVSLADRIAYERGEEIGDVVGYQVRLEKVMPNKPGVILFCTTGILLKKLQTNPELKTCSHVILDEVHERSVDTDLLMLLLRRAMKKNPNLKVIIMSATINTDMFKRYFNCPAIKIPGRLYPVEMNFLEDIEKLPHIRDYQTITYGYFEENDKIVVSYEKILQLIKWISTNKPHGAVLCFLPGWNEILRVKQMLEDDPLESENQLVLAIHSKETSFMRHQIFQEAPAGTRKIILATDIAETGITISDVCYVIDSAIRKDSQWNDERDVMCINNTWISKANIQQRKGRAGRVRPGFSYHLIERTRYEKLQPYPMANVLLSPLEQIILDSKTYTDEKAKDFLGDLLEPPLPTRIQKGVDYLIDLGALDHEENLTVLGKRMAVFSMHPKFSKALVYSSIFNCVEPVLIIACAYFSDDVYFTGLLNNKQAIRDIKSTYHPFSDHLAFSWLYKSWNEHKLLDSFLMPTFCKRNKLRHNRMELLKRIKKMFMQQMITCRLLPKQVYDNLDPNIKENQYENNDELVRAVLYSATQQLLEHKDIGFKNGVLRTGLNELRSAKNKAIISGDSVNFKRPSWPSPFLTYFHSEHCEMRKRLVIRESSIISPMSALLFSQGSIECYERDDKTNIKVRVNRRHTVNFSCDKTAADVIVRFRDIVWSVVQYNLKKQRIDISGDYEMTVMSQYTSKLMSIVAEILQTSGKCIEDASNEKSNLK